MKTRVLRFGAVVALALAVVAGFGATGASADVTTATVDLHFRACPLDAVDVFADCHDNPIADVDAGLFDWLECTTDDHGNCLFEEVEPGFYLWTVDSDVIDPEDLVGSYCSEAAAPETFLEEDGIFEVAAGDVVTCDVYFFDADLDPAHPADSGDAEAAPNTGAGAMAGDASLPLAAAGALAVAGLAVASRKRSFR